MNELFMPYGLCGTLLENRVVLAHMTRTRTREKNSNKLIALYFAQQASTSLITEGLEARGYLYTPGIYTAE
ncbi:NADH:flavin oxidoreductases, Old Yellow Enzyme family [Pseudomonas sp. KD5]|uniref:2,4-dienoyl-CoA reductase-like NADH-dependent reductase (Old Yellow Enzyme family) n=1 Tax=Pseudomonas umsongensis TaxID=198618 RepID=A0ACC5M8Q8_9PSED|nr:2,4-dienoyl-CoA reductase-like NADH-dependent reductase (Old Yellow Enzyme family) [Pseudomonas umsongensis]NMN74678.1 NADH:flavin oxidoreductases, Old Yellow Enzyme family [Pseudomonas sp. KD5]